MLIKNLTVELNSKISSNKITVKIDTVRLTHKIAAADQPNGIFTLETNKLTFTELILNEDSISFTSILYTWFVRYLNHMNKYKIYYCCYCYCLKQIEFTHAHKYINRESKLHKDVSDPTILCLISIRLWKYSDEIHAQCVHMFDSLRRDIGKWSRRGEQKLI